MMQVHHKFEAWYNRPKAWGMICLPDKPGAWSNCATNPSHDPYASQAWFIFAAQQGRAMIQFFNMFRAQSTITKSLVTSSYHHAEGMIHLREKSGAWSDPHVKLRV